MTELQSPQNAAFWSESLAEELLQFLTKRLKCPDTAAEITHEIYIRFCQTSDATPINNARALAYRIAITWRMITNARSRSGTNIMSI